MAASRPSQSLFANCAGTAAEGELQSIFSTHSAILTATTTDENTGAIRGSSANFSDGNTSDIQRTFSDA
jgi:hypothetical protein